MTKNEFDILTFVLSNDQKGKTKTVTDVLNKFKNLPCNPYLTAEGLICYLHDQGYLSSNERLIDDPKRHTLNYDAVLRITPDGYHAMDEYKETVSRLNRAEKNIKINRAVSITAIFLPLLVDIVLSNI